MPEDKVGMDTAEATALFLIMHGDSIFGYLIPLRKLGATSLRSSLVSVVLSRMKKNGVKPVQFGLVMVLNLMVSAPTPHLRIARSGKPPYGMKTRLRAGQ